MRGIRAAATVAGLVACAALAGCGAPAPAGEPLAGPEPVPVASPTRSRTPSASAAPVTPAVTSTASRAAAPRRPPSAPPRTHPPVPPSAGATTASPRPGLPDLSRTAPPSPSAPPTPRATPTAPASSPPPSSRAASPVPSSPVPDAATALHIGDWSAQVVRGDQETVDACRDAVQWDGPELGSEDGYALRTAVVVGHDYCGFQRFATLPIGTAVTATTPRGTFTYRVYAHHTEPGRGTPSHGLYWGDLTLQSCVGPNTGFSYLRRE
ncbi:hypothetical protein [Streptomyces sp. NPDC088733]|uniref:hypothetical protein n=1 Tax=Streptomyces sp. NPDC088733 TaxID=3365880 RepID=UPI003826EE63